MGGLAEKVLTASTAIGPRGGDAEMLDKQESINHQTNFKPLSTQKNVNMLNLFPTRLTRTLATAALRNASSLGQRKFSGLSGFQPPRGWVPTPYVTETIVRQARCHRANGLSADLTA